MSDRHRKANKRIYLHPDTKQRLRQIGDRSVSDDEVVSGLLKTHDVCTTISKALGDPLDPVNVSHTVMKAGRGIAKLGAVMGYTSDQFWDLGLSRVQRAKVITFFETDDPDKIRIQLAVGSIQELIKESGFPLEDILTRLVNRIEQIYQGPDTPEKEERENEENS